MVKCVEFHPSARVAVVAATNGTAGLFQVCFELWMDEFKISQFHRINYYEFVLWSIFYLIYYLIYWSSRYFLRWYKHLFSNILQFCVTMFFHKLWFKKRMITVSINTLKNLNLCFHFLIFFSCFIPFPYLFIYNV